MSYTEEVIFEMYDEALVDAILWNIQDRGTDTRTPSRIARSVGTARNIRPVLQYLEDLGLIAGEGNGSWRRYRSL